ncbi:NAD(P)H-binding protein [Mumia sp. zg.B53]|uniref:NAD(P)H-binding protein n=1 Tax=Mumia sp. zg.B53 TaxID=2855449 RepID=UPI00210638C1|nr:NAD(P)H-binding protein [Mumia sp. zg.B53]
MKGLDVDVFIIGVTGGVGRLLTQELRGRGASVRGLVRRPGQRADLAASGVDAVVGDLTTMSQEDLAPAFGSVDAVVFATGSNGGSRAVTDALDAGGLRKTVGAMRLAGIDRLLHVSVMPEAWRERGLDAETEHYFAVKKEADIFLSHSDLDWVILRPSMLHDRDGLGRVSLGPAERHEEIARADVASVLAGLLYEHRIGRQVLELNQGTTPVAAAIAANVR